MIELIADQGISICKSHCTGWERHRVAAWPGIGEEVPKVGSGFIGFDDAAVVGVGDERMAAGEPTGKGHTAEGYTASLCKRLYDSAWSGVRDFERLVVVLVGDKDIAVH